MIERRYIAYVLSVLIAATFAVGLGQRLRSAQPQAKIAPALQPKAPVQIAVAEAGATGDKLPARLVGKAYVQNYVVQNLSTANVLAVSTRWTPKDAEGNSLPGGGCSSQSTVTTAQPVLKTGESRTFQQTFTQGITHAVAEIDLVLLDDGSAFGANRCGDLDKIQARLEGLKMAHLAMLHVLETRGPLALETFLRTRAAEYRQEGHNDAFMKPKFLGR